jgi:hypothetical protein
MTFQLELFYFVFNILNFSVFFIFQFQGRFLGATEIGRLRAGYHALLSRLRPDAVAVVDAFDFSDRELRWSALGRRDGFFFLNFTEKYLIF